MMIQSDVLQQSAITHGFFTRQGGVSTGLYKSLNIGLGSGDIRQKVLENRQRVADSLSIAHTHLVTPHQIHSADVLHVEGPWTEDAGRKADALVTGTPGLSIGIATADCGPVLLADAKAGIIGAAHAGWKGALSGILENTLAAMEKLGASRTGTVAVLGPTISQSAYEVGPEFYQRFKDEDTGHECFFIPSRRAAHFMFDLPGFITAKLKQAGAGKVVDMALCTYEDETRFFSYRRATHRNEPDYGRLMSAIALRGS